jgi:formylglycine-generating enzyme required for sulfatase activity
LSRKSAHAYRLPSASEWEYAQKAGAGAASPWGASAASACAYANVADQNARQRFPGWDAFDCSDGYVGTAPVGTFKANAFGLNDMLGNVFEWVQDCWTPDYSNAPVDGSPAGSGECRMHESRGGSWFTSPSYVRASYRNRFDAAERTTSLGFRVVREMTK